MSDYFLKPLPGDLPPRHLDNFLALVPSVAPCILAVHPELLKTSLAGFDLFSQAAQAMAKHLLKTSPCHGVIKWMRSALCARLQNAQVL